MLDVRIPEGFDVLTPLISTVCDINVILPKGRDHSEDLRVDGKTVY